MSILNAIGPIVALITKVLDKFIPGYKDKGGVRRYKHEEEARKWDEKTNEAQKERFSRSLLRHLSSRDAQKKK